MELPARLDLSDPGTRSLASAIDLILMARRRDRRGETAPRRLTEIGCAPGAWLAHFARRGFDVSGIDSSPRGAELTRRNFEMQGLTAEILEADILEAGPPTKAFDVAISIGVVEHFSDPLPMFKAHANCVVGGGTVIIAVPNLRGFNGWLQNRLDPEWLALHNLEILSSTRLEELGRAAGMECRSVEYAGGFNPNLFEWKDRSFLGAATTRTGLALRKMRRADQWNSKWFSSMIVAEFVVAEDEE